MSAKLPIGDTINEAFQFGLHRWFAVLRFGWLPTLAAMAVILVFAFAVFDFGSMPSSETQLESFEEVQDVFRFPIPIVVLLGLAAYALIFYLMSGVLASIYRLAALGEDRPGIFHLRTDGPAMRVFFAFIILTLINIAISVASLSLGLSLSGSSWADVLESCRQLFAMAGDSELNDASSAEQMELLAAPFKAFGYGLLIATILSIYVNIKLIPFVAGSAAENRIILFRSFAMTTGHFWSLLGVMILFFLLYMVIAIAFQIVIAVLQGVMILLMGATSSFAIVGVLSVLVIFALSIWYSCFVYALQFGLQGIIYRRLKSDA